MPPIVYSFAPLKLAVMPLVCAVVLAVGCGPSGPPLGDVEGLVTLGGEPLPHARIEFQPVEAGAPSYAISDASGRYRLRFTGNRYGAVIGEHTVRVSTFAQNTGGQPPTAERVPARYNDASELRKNVAQGANEIDLPLESQ